ncbi:ARM-repeat/Tetratricopeptide repeat (TPR)-like protein [Euphorbia peplus]|nr:ARM-repeat/Tetratricopeptide repeat (TPR)-like protein [Euphorbia peplus]
MTSKYKKNSLKCTSKMLHNTTCTNPFCFFCSMNEPNPSLRTSKITQCFKQMPLRDDQEQVLTLSSLWNIAMTQPNDPEFPCLGIFECMGKMIDRGLKDKKWLIKDQNIYIPYYAAHIIGSYARNTPEFAEKAVNSGVVRPLIELLRGKITWIEQRVAVRALGHLARHETAFEAISKHQEIIESTMELACNCFGMVYDKFLSIKDRNRLEYHSDLLTRGVGGVEMENRKAEKWAKQIQCWCLYLLNCFVCKERFLNLICKKRFLKDLCGMCSALGNVRTSPGGIGVLRSLCNTKIGRESIANLEEVIINICNTSRSSDDWQEIAIDSLLLLLKDSTTRYKVIKIAALFLSDLVELRQIQNDRTRLGDAITQTLLLDFHKIRYGGLKLRSGNADEALKKTWELKVERRKREKLMSTEEVKEKKAVARILKQEGNKKFWSGETEKAVMKYTKALQLCPLKMRKERMILYSNRAQAYLVLKNPEAAISDCTQALSLSSSKNLHSKSLWRRCQAYDMKGLFRESLTDCLTFIDTRTKAEKRNNNVKIMPMYVASMMTKQMNATWPFRSVKESRRMQRKEIGDGDGDPTEERHGHRSRRIKD